LKFSHYVNQVLNRFGFHLSRGEEERLHRVLGQNAEFDIKFLLGNVPEPVVFDVGGNVGQAVDRFKNLLPNSLIYSFEPTIECIPMLKEKESIYNSVKVFNLALGAREMELDFYLNSSNVMNSFLNTDSPRWGDNLGKRIVKTETLDSFCQKNAVSHINLLKIDTQGFELEVLKGSMQMLSNNSIELVYLEIIFSEMYSDLPTLAEIYTCMTQSGFKLVAFYDFYTHDKTADWCDALFYNPSFEE
jgi:FkbM family methyltransferase